MRAPLPTARFARFACCFAACLGRVALSASCALAFAACNSAPPDGEPIVRLAQSITETLDAHPSDCDALGQALRPQLGKVDKALSLELRRLGVSAHRLDDQTRGTLEGFARKFAAANQRCRDSAAFKDALAALEGQLDDR